MLVSASALLVHVAQALESSSYPLLAAACEHDNPTGRTDSTLADCLAPATACTRIGDGVACAVNGTGICAARDPESPLHAILDGGPCWRANHSAIAVALVALEAELEIDGPDGKRMLSAEEFFATQSGDWRVLSARLPAAAAGGFQRLSSAGASDAGAPAICLAAVRRTDGDVRLVLGGVSPRPYRVYTSVEEEAMAGGLDDDTIAGLAERALLDAESDPISADKVDAAAALLRRAIEEIDANSA
jgi:xanthine dehydrogenase YagS FAD-binding subunit